MINIVVASDENYAPHLETLLVSIGENNKYEEQIQVSIFDGGLSAKTKEWITALSNRYSNILFSFLQMTEKDIEEKLGGGIGRDRSLAAYSRIFIPEKIADDKAIYLDVDAIVIGDLRELYKIDLSGYAIAGVVDTNPIKRHRNVGLSDTEVYINSGMIIWNLDKCREINVTEQFLQFIRLHNGQIDAMDQGTINGVLGKQSLIKIIHPRYNVFTSLFQLNRNQICRIYGLPDYYSDAKIKEARNSPVFVHYTPNMTTRPWVKHCRHPLKYKYWQYRNQTQFCTRVLEEDSRSLRLKGLGVLYRCCPTLFHRLSSLRKKS